MRVSDAYPPGGDPYERLDQMDSFRRFYSRMVYEHFKSLGCIELPRDTFRFTPVRRDGSPIIRANRLVFYYFATVNGYDGSRTWLSPADCLDLGHPMLNRELDDYCVLNENALFDIRVHRTFGGVTEHERVWLRYSMTPYINSQVLGLFMGSRGDSIEGDPESIIGKIRFPSGVKLVDGDFFYDRFTDTVSRPPFDSSCLDIHDYLFDLAVLSARARQKFLRINRSARNVRNHRIIGIGEDVVERLSALMTLSSLGLDISGISRGRVVIEGDDFDLAMREILTDDFHLYRWANQAYDAHEIAYVIPDSRWSRSRAR